MGRSVTFVVAVLTLAAARPAVAASDPDAAPVSNGAVARALGGVNVVERIGAHIPAAVFTDEEGHAVAPAGDLARPKLISFNYSRCPMLCSLQLAGLAHALKDLPTAGVPAFDVLTVGLDPSEPPGEAERQKQIYVRQAGGSARVGNAWHFVRGMRQSVDALADAVGFHYRYDPASREYFHPATLIVLTPDGRVSRYLHGIDYEPRALADAIAGAARGEVLTPEAQSGLRGFLLQCIRYDSPGRAPLGVRVMRLGGLFVLAGLGALVVASARGSRRRRT